MPGQGVPRGRPRSGKGSKQFSPSGGEASARRKAQVEGASPRTRAPGAPAAQAAASGPARQRPLPGWAAVGAARRGAGECQQLGGAAGVLPRARTKKGHIPSSPEVRSALLGPARPGRSPDPKMSARPPIACPPPARCFGFHRSAAAPPRPPLRLRADVRTTNPVRPRGLLAPSGSENYNSRLATGDFKGGGGVFRGGRGVAGARPMYDYSFRRSVPCEFWDL